MKLYEFIETMRTEHAIELRDPDNYQINICRSNSAGWKPYRDMDIADWFVASSTPERVVVMLAEEPAEPTLKQCVNNLFGRKEEYDG